jgi:vitamin B12 transporter
MSFRSILLRPAPVVVLSLVALSVSAPASGQTQLAAAALPPVVVTASRSEQPITELLADVTVIRPEEIARAGAQALTDLLQRQPGVEIIRNGGPAGVSGVFLRGANAAQTLVLIDGVRVGSSSTGAATLEAIPLEQIDHVEILRGPASSLYGADAIGGVIQIFTRRGGPTFAANASAGGGSYGTWTATTGASGSAGAVSYAVQVGARASDGFNAIVDPSSFAFDPDRDGYSSANSSANVSWQWATEQAVDVRYLRNRLDAQFDSFPPGPDDRTITVVETWQVASRNALTPHWKSLLSAASAVDDSVSKTGSGDFPFRTTQRQYTWQNELALARLTPLPGVLTVGYDRREERVAADVAFAVASRDTDALFATYRLGHDAHTLQANLRHDDSTQFGGRTTGTIAYGYRISPQWRVNASYGTGFKAPTFNDLYFPGFSNPNLAPETSRNVEAGVHWGRSMTIAGASTSIEARAVAYRNRVRDLIVFQCDADFIVCAPQNVARATLEGVSLSADMRVEPGTTISASLDLASPEDDDTGRLLPRRARQHGTLTAVHVLGPVRVGVEVVASSHRFDDAANTVRLGGFAVVNLTAEWQMARNVSAFVRADNVFDRDYQLAASYSTGGATVFGGVRWRL